MCGIDLKLGSTDLLFKGKKAIKETRSCFSNELTFVLSEIELITNDGISILKTGQSLHTYEQGHIVTFIEDTTLLYLHLK
jgi:hypothetical protein